MPQMIVEFQLHGFEELRKELETMSRNVQRHAANIMASSGAAIVRNEAKGNVMSSKYSDYFSYIKEGKGEYAGMTIGGRSKWGGIRTHFTQGWVAKNIFMGKSKKGKGSGKATWRVFLAPQAWFGRFIEYGSPRLPARPFIRPALSKNINRIIDVMKFSLMRFLNAQRCKIIQVKG
jgi:HK97 gp10 family phage protein